MQKLIPGAVFVVLTLGSLASPAACEEPPDLWTSLILEHYIDMNNGNNGRCEEPYSGWDIKYDSRAPGSLVKSKVDSLSERSLRAIRGAFAADTIPNGIQIPPESYSAWELEGGALVVTFKTQAPGERTETEPYWDEALDRKVQKPAYANVFTAAVLVNGDSAEVIYQEGKSDVYLETYYLNLKLQDFVDLDRDGYPEAILFEACYECQCLIVFTIGQNGVVERTRKWGCSL